MAVDMSPPGGAARTVTLPLDPTTLTHAYRRPGAVEVPAAAAERRSMPPITRSKMLTRKDLQRLMRAEAECGRQRPPTPARPSLPQLDGSIRGRGVSPGLRGSRSRSEPRSAAQDEDELDQTADLLDCSIRSDGGGWRSVRSRAPVTPSAGDDSPAVTPAGVTLPPIGISGILTPVKRMTRQETQRLLAQAKVNLQAMETAKPLPVTSSGP